VHHFVRRVFPHISFAFTYIRLIKNHRGSQNTLQHTHIQFTNYLRYKMSKLMKIFSGQKVNKTEKKVKNSNGIFRRSRRSHEKNPTIEQSITWTMSEEAASESSSSPTHSHSLTNEPLVDVSKIRRSVESHLTSEPVLTFTETEVMRNELNRIRQFAEKDTEIANLKQVYEELEITHSKEMAEKEEEITKAVDTLEEKENELSHAKDDLLCAKKEMATMGSFLIQCQHELDAKLNMSWLPWVNN
jgi:hypothetical protein